MYLFCLESDNNLSTAVTYRRNTSASGKFPFISSFMNFTTGASHQEGNEAGTPYNIKNISFTDTADVTAPILSLINCTSCNPPNGDSVEPYASQDLTPTFTLSTDEDAICRFSSFEQNHADKGDGRNCTTTGGSVHTCTLGDNESLVPTNDTIFLSCADSLANVGFDNLTIDLTSVGANLTGFVKDADGNTLLDAGITVSVYAVNDSSNMIANTTINSSGEYHFFGLQCETLHNVVAFERGNESRGGGITTHVNTTCT